MNQKKAARLNPSEKELRDSVYSWINDINGIAENEIDEVPKGWATLEMISKIKGINIKTMEYQLKQSVAKGKVKRKQFRVQNGRCKQMIWHYYKNET